MRHLARNLCFFREHVGTTKLPAQHGEFLNQITGLRLLAVSVVVRVCAFV
jgi:hypothetical protein